MPGHRQPHKTVRAAHPSQNLFPLVHKLCTLKPERESSPSPGNQQNVAAGFTGKILCLNVEQGPRLLFQRTAGRGCSTFFILGGGSV